MNKIKRRFPIEYYVINDILMEWNPLNIDGPALQEEYLRYIPNIISIRSDKDQLFKYLENILKNEMGLIYNQNINKEIVEVSNKINKV